MKVRLDDIEAAAKNDAMAAVFRKMRESDAQAKLYGLAQKNEREQ